MKNVKLTSSPLVHTPGIFRWLQHRFQTGEKLEAVNVLHEGYGLTRRVASGLLSGRIPAVVNEEEGTVTFSH